MMWNDSDLLYKGYQGSIELIPTGGYRGKILHIKDLVTYKAWTYSGMITQFQVAVENYLDTCKQLGGPK